MQARAENKVRLVAGKRGRGVCAGDGLFRGKVEAATHSGGLLMHMDCDERACARARHLVGAALASQGCGRGGRHWVGVADSCVSMFCLSCIQNTNTQKRVPCQGKSRFQ